MSPLACRALARSPGPKSPASMSGIRPRPYRIQHFLSVNVPRQWQMHEDAVHVRIPIEPMDEREQMAFGCVDRELVFDRFHADLNRLRRPERSISVWAWDSRAANSIERGASSSTGFIPIGGTALAARNGSPGKARFEDPAEARGCFYYSRLLDRLAVHAQAVFDAAAAELMRGPLDGGDYARGLRSRAALQIGQFFEKQKSAQRAMDLYRSWPSPECNERLVRLLHASGAKDDAKCLLEQMIDDPGSDDEHTFAADLYARKFDGRRTGACTDLLRASREVVVDEIHRGTPEAGVAGFLGRENHTVYFAENLLWHNLFGLLFWDELLSYVRNLVTA